MIHRNDAYIYNDVNWTTAEIRSSYDYDITMHKTRLGRLFQPPFCEFAECFAFVEERYVDGVTEVVVIELSILLLITIL